jgi:hypothetical protein
MPFVFRTRVARLPWLVAGGVAHEIRRALRLSAAAIFDLDGNDVALDTTAVKALCGVPDACLQHPAGLDPRQRRLRRVSKDGVIVSSWFETAQERLLTMRSDSHRSEMTLIAISRRLPGYP